MDNTERNYDKFKENTIKAQSQQPISPENNREMQKHSPLAHTFPQFTSGRNVNNAEEQGMLPLPELVPTNTDTENFCPSSSLGKQIQSAEVNLDTISQNLPN